MVQTKRHKKQKHQKTVKQHRPQITEKDDFYTFINKKWLNHHKYVPQNRGSTNAFVLLQEKVDNEMRDILFKKVFKETTPTARRTKHLFESMSHWNNALAEKHLDQCIFQLNQYRRERTMYEMFAWFMKSGFSLPFHFYIMADIKNPKKFSTYIEEGGLSFQNKDFYFGKSRSSREGRQKYLGFLKNLFSQVSGSGSCFKPENVIAVEESLAKYIYDKVNTFVLEETNNRVSVTQVEFSEHNKNSAIYGQ